MLIQLRSPTAPSWPAVQWSKYTKMSLCGRDRILREQQEINRRTMERKEKERQKLEQERRKEREEEDALEQVGG